MSYLEPARRVLQIEIAELQRLETRLDDSFDTAVQLLLETIRAGKKIVVVGIGKSGHIAEKISATLTSTGSLSVVLHSVNATHGDLGVIADGDAILILSASGETEEIVALKILKPEIATDQAVQDNFKRELCLARKITHKNVCRIHDFSRSNGTAYASMEFIEGESLLSRLNRVG